MKRRLWILLGPPALVLACQTGGEPSEAPAVAAQVSAPQAAVTETVAASEPTASVARSPRTPTDFTGPIVIDDAVRIDGGPADSLDEEGFAGNAFPPMLPKTEHHENAWLRDDCLLCHEQGLTGAPVVQHRGMSALLAEANCRTCHVAADPSAGPLTNMAGEEVIEFLVDAFPPALPVDNSHSNAWLRKDCLSCHLYGVQGASQVRHHGMSELLLEANCRSCHVPGEGAGSPPQR